MSDPTPPYQPPQYQQQPPFPQYQQPQYQQPAQPQQAVYMPPAFQPPKKQSRAGLWIGLSIAALLVCCGGAAGVYFLASKYSDTVADQKSPTVPRTPVGDLQSGQPTGVYKVTAPDTLGKRKKITDPEHTNLVAQVTSAMQSNSGIKDVVAGYYGTADAKVDKVYLVAVTTNAAMTRAQFAVLFDGMATSAGLGNMSDAADVDAGPLGGFARCGNLTIQTLPSAACAWDDAGTFGMIVWYNRALTQVQPEFAGMRGEVETKS